MSKKRILLDLRILAALVSMLARKHFLSNLQNWVKLRVAIIAIFLTFVISCNFRQFWPIFVAVSGDLIGHFLYTSNFLGIFANFPEVPRRYQGGTQGSVPIPPDAAFGQYTLF